jgi:hypothetical protein
MGESGSRITAQKHNVFAQKHNRPSVRGLGWVTKVVLSELGLGARLLASVLCA